MDTHMSNTESKQLRGEWRPYKGNKERLWRTDETGKWCETSYCRFIKCPDPKILNEEV